MNYYKKNFIKFLLALMSVLVMITIFNPFSMPVYVSLFLPVAVCFGLYYLLRMAVAYFFPSFSNTEINAISMFGVFFPAIMLMLATLGQLSFVDFVLSLSLSSGLVFYILKSRKQQTN